MIECVKCELFVGDSAGETDYEELAKHIAEYHPHAVPVREFAGERKVPGRSDRVEDLIDSVVDEFADEAGEDGDD